MAQRDLNIILKLKDQASKELKKFNAQVENNREGFEKLAIVSGVAFAALGTGIFKSVKNANELTESINAVNVVFGEGASNILKFGETSARSVGLASSEFNQLSAVTGALLQDTGLPMQEVAGITTDLAVRAADMASVMNTDVKDALSAVNQAIRGETEAIRRYTGDVTDATLNQHLMSQGINRTVKEMTEQEKRLLRLEVIMKQTNKFAGDFANTSEELANVTRIVTGEIKDLTAEIGKGFIPGFKAVLNVIRPVISFLLDFAKENKATVVTLIAVATAVSGVVAFLTALVLMKATIIAFFAAIGTAIASATGGITLLTGALAVLVAFLYDKYKPAQAEVSEEITKHNDKIKQMTGRLAELKKPLQDTSAEMKAMADEIAGANKNLEDLQKRVTATIEEHAKRQTDFNMRKAELILEQEQKIADTETQIEEKKNEKKEALAEGASAKRINQIGSELSALQSSMQMEKEVLVRHRDLQIGIEEELAEVKRRASLTEFERKVETLLRERVQELKAHKEKLELLNEEVKQAKLQRDKLLKVQKEYDEKRIQQARETAEEVMRLERDIARSRQAIYGANALITQQKRSGLMGSDTSGFALSATPFADGGIVSRPTLGLVGEAGPEAIIPLNKAKGMGGINLTINGDVTGMEIIEKVKTALMREVSLNSKIDL